MSIHKEGGSTKWLHGRKWYYRLHHKEGSNARPLFSDYSHSSLDRQLLVSLRHLDRDGSEWKLFTVFPSYIEYLSFVESIQEVQRSCFEVLTGRQKPHFDLDLNLSEIPDGEDVMLELRDLIIDACIKLIPEIDLHRDMLFFTSHGPNKRSLHITINNWYHNDNKEAREFYRLVTEHIHSKTGSKYGETLYKLVDHNVYGENQQFRIVGTHKLKTTRTKVLVPQFTYQGVVYKHEFSDSKDPNIGLTKYQINRKRSLTILRESLVGFTSDSRWVPIKMPEVTNAVGDHADLTEEEVSSAMKIAATFNWETGKGCLPDGEEWSQPLFSVDNIKANQIILKRLAPQWCLLCNRLHEGQNPWIKIFNGQCYWHCRQFQGRKCVYLGKINPHTEAPVEIEDVFEPVLSIGGVPMLSIGGVTQPIQAEIPFSSVIPEQPITTHNSNIEVKPLSLGTAFKPLSFTEVMAASKNVGLLSQKNEAPEKVKHIRQKVIPKDIPDSSGGREYIPKSQRRTSRPIASALKKM